MLKKIKKSILIIIASFSLFAAPLAPALLASGSAAAASSGVQSSLCQGANAAGGNGATACGTAGNGSNDATSSLNKVAGTITNWFSIIVGVAAVLMIIYAGFRYITSGGSSEKVGTAKNSLIYAVIGLIIVALAQIIVHFVINATNNSLPPSTI